VEVRRQEDRVRTYAACPLGRRSREDAELARLIGRSGDDGTRTSARDNDGKPLQLGAPLQLNGDVERVHVDMSNAALPFTPAGHARKFRASPGRGPWRGPR